MRGVWFLAGIARYWFFFALVCISLPGCGHHQAGGLTLTWKGFDGKTDRDPEKARYILDGNVIGEGRAGFAAILRAMERSRPGTEILVFPDERVLDELTTVGSGQPQPHANTVPFRDDKRLYEEFYRAARKKGLVVWLLAGPPGTILNKDGIDMRTRLGEEIDALDLTETAVPSENR